MNFCVDSGNYSFDEDNILRFEGRDVILVKSEGGWKQGFYRSSGRNSGRAGRWFPFDGYIRHIHWFDKGRFCLFNQKYTELERYGCQILKDIGDYLTLISINEGREVDWIELNTMVAQNKEEILKQPFAPYWLKMSPEEGEKLGEEIRKIQRKHP